MTHTAIKQPNLIKIALYQPDIPQNTAAIIRICACFNTRLDIIEPCGFIMNDKRFKRIAMDYINSCKIKTFNNFEDFKIVKDRKRIILMTTKANIKYNKFKFQNNDTILFGRESAGVPKSIHNIVDHKLIIPIHPKTRSLNIASSVAIALSEALRQNNLYL